MTYNAMLCVMGSFCFAMTDRFYQWLVGLISSGDIHPFYVSREWRTLSAAILRSDHRNCQICGRANAADLVHHVRHVKDFPRMALSRYYTDEDGQKQRNLLSVCRVCHENVCHPERLRRHQPRDPGFSTAERWD